MHDPSIPSKDKKTELNKYAYYRSQRVQVQRTDLSSQKSLTAMLRFWLHRVAPCFLCIYSPAMSGIKCNEN